MALRSTQVPSQPATGDSRRPGGARCVGVSPRAEVTASPRYLAPRFWHRLLVQSGYPRKRPAFGGSFLGVHFFLWHTGWTGSGADDAFFALLPPGDGETDKPETQQIRATGGAPPFILCGCFCYYGTCWSPVLHSFGLLARFGPTPHDS